MSRHLITVLLLIAALLAYAAGFALPATSLVILGGLAEVAFWVHLFKGPRRREPEVS